MNSNILNRYLKINLIQVVSLFAVISSSGISYSQEKVFLNKPVTEVLPVIVITDTSHYTHSDNKSFLLHFPKLIYGQAVSVFSINKGNLPWIAGAVGITAGLLYMDGRIDKSVTPIGKTHRWIGKTSSVITNFGGNYGLIAVGLIAGYGVISSDNKLINTSLYSLESALASGLWTRLGKLLTGRERPSASYVYSKRTGGIWKGPINQIRNKNHQSISSYDAFPSGHTAMAFSIASTFASQYKDNIIVPIVSYFLASAVGISRMIEHTHWASDVFVGGCIGYLCGTNVVHLNNNFNKNYKKDAVQVNFSPSISTTGYGANVNLSF